MAQRIVPREWEAKLLLVGLIEPRVEAQPLLEQPPGLDGLSPLQMLDDLPSRGEVDDGGVDVRIVEPAQLEKDPRHAGTVGQVGLGFLEQLDSVVLPLAELQSATPRGGVVEGRLQVRLGQA